MAFCFFALCDAWCLPAGVCRRAEGGDQKVAGKLGTSGKFQTGENFKCLTPSIKAWIVLDC